MAAANKETFMASLAPGASLPIKETMLAIYAYEISYPGFADDALCRLESLGCSTARETYERVVDAYKKWHIETAEKPAAHWWRLQLERDEEIQKRKDGALLWELEMLTEKQLRNFFTKSKKKGVDPVEVADFILDMMEDSNQ